jgi:hypothetical protein
MNAKLLTHIKEFEISDSYKIALFQFCFTLDFKELSLIEG